MKTIAAYNSHFGEEEDKDLEWYKEAADQMLVVVRVHYNMEPAILDMQVGHTRGLPVAAGGTEKMGMEQLLWVECGKEEEADAQNHMGEEGDHSHPLVAAPVTDNKVFGDDDPFVEDWTFEFGVPLKGSCY